MIPDPHIILILAVLSLPTSHQEESQEGDTAAEDPCLYTYKAFQPNLSSIKEKVAFITVNRCQQEKQERERRKKRRRSQKKKNKDTKLVLKSLESKKAKRGKKDKRGKNKREGRKRSKKGRKGPRDRRGKEHKEFQDWKRFVATKTERDQALDKRDKSMRIRSSGAKGSSKWRKLLRQRQSGGLTEPQHISHHLG